MSLAHKPGTLGSRAQGWQCACSCCAGSRAHMQAAPGGPRESFSSLDAALSAPSAWQRLRVGARPSLALPGTGVMNTVALGWGPSPPAAAWPLLVCPEPPLVRRAAALLQWESQWGAEGWAAMVRPQGNPRSW